MSQQDTAHAWWSRLRHQGLLLSPVVMLERFPPPRSLRRSTGWPELRDAYTRFVSTAEARQGEAELETGGDPWPGSMPCWRTTSATAEPARQAAQHPGKAHRRRPHRHPLRHDPPAPGRLRRRRRHHPGAAGHGRHVAHRSAEAGAGRRTLASSNCCVARAIASACSPTAISSASSMRASISSRGASGRADRWFDDGEGTEELDGLRQLLSPDRLEAGQGGHVGPARCGRGVPQAPGRSVERAAGKCPAGRGTLAR